MHRPERPSLPVDAIAPQLLAAMESSNRAVLIAPPGAGKTTRLPPLIGSAGWCSGQVLVLAPRRLAARAAAERMAEEAGEPVGQSIGYMTRMDSRTSAATRVVVMTEAIFVARIMADPELDGVGAVLFDEAHERHLDSDFALALALEAQATFRPDLRLLVMSATLDGGRFAALLADDGGNPAPLIESEGEAHPLDVIHVGRRSDMRIEADMASQIARIWRDDAQGDILAFLPGVAEITRCAEALEGRLPGAVVHLLHGQCDPAAQRAAIRRDPDGRRKLVLATSIAESSVTLDGVRIVVDSGLARRAEFDRAVGMARLVTGRVSLASARQRAGRAARQGPGRVYRLWDKGGDAGLLPFDAPEILVSDLQRLVLLSSLWGATDPRDLAWLDAPTPAAFAHARERLLAIGAVDQAGAVTDHGKRLATMAMAPAEAHMLIEGARRGQALDAARLILLMQEKGLGGRSLDLAERMQRFIGDRSARAKQADAMAQRMAQAAQGEADDGADQVPLAMLLAFAWPDRVARRRGHGQSGDGFASYLSAGGRAFVIDNADPLARCEWLVIADAMGSAAGARISAALATDLAEIETHLADLIVQRSDVRFDLATRRVQARKGRFLGAIALASAPDPSPPAEAVEAALLAAVQAHGLDMLPMNERGRALIDRAAFAGLDALDPARLLDEAADWLAPLLAGRRGFDEVSAGAVVQALENRLDWDQRQHLDALAPTHFASPAGTSHAIDYAAPAGPTVSLRVQALFGLAAHPCIGKAHIPLVLELLSPANRPIQTTRDLPAFWAGSWRDVAKDMRGRYPRHVWPDDPAAALASLKTKNALKRSGS